MTPVVPDDVPDVIFVDRRISLADGIAVRFFLISNDDLPLIHQCDLGVRDKRRKENRMRSSALRAFEPEDAKADHPIRCSYRANVIPMNAQASCMAAGTDETVKREQADDSIVKMLRYRIVFINEDCYHYSRNACVGGCSTIAVADRGRVHV
ncbi:MAG: hypothetical protein SPL71_03390 [Oribacterium sp.]|nr:hypothetical protein [Oribacterium sp.]